jgi:hypothetical protein
LYDKISREDVLAHAYAQCRSNKGAPGVDGQEFADIEAYGVQRWLGELALARRVFIPKANGKLRPLGISTLRDRVCMTAAMVVLEPIFEADLPPEQYAYRPGHNAQQAVVEVKALLFRGHPEVVDADLADYFGSIPHAELLKSVAGLLGVQHAAATTPAQRPGVSVAQSPSRISLPRKGCRVCTQGKRTQHGRSPKAPRIMTTEARIGASRGSGKRMPPAPMSEPNRAPPRSLSLADG